MRSSSASADASGGGHVVDPRVVGAGLALVALALSGCGSTGPNRRSDARSQSGPRAATSTGSTGSTGSGSTGSGSTGGGGPVVVEPSGRSGSNATCRSLPPAARLARAAGLDTAGAELEADTELCVLVIHDQQVVRFGIARGDQRAELRSIGYRPSRTVPGGVEAGGTLAVVNDGATYSVGFDSDTEPDDVIARDEALLRLWGKI